ncbi:IPT/TIG domain-containing protein, partial [Candidatus Saccharibacteria bacterium]|nr:IPT/TIG domain-containing protein [Candidatus Saccharibacteria bacterium]
MNKLFEWARDISPVRSFLFLHQPRFRIRKPKPAVVIVATLVLGGLLVGAALQQLGNSRAASFSVDSISPSSGPKTGGTTVTITGTNFEQGVEWQQVATGLSHSVALDTDGNVYTWGYNANGQLGNGNYIGDNLPIKISDGEISGSALTAGLKITQIAAGASHTLALDEGGNLYAWGYNSYGQIGNGDNTTGNLPIKISDGAIAGSPLVAGLKITKVAGGGSHTLALDENGNLYAWGRNNSGQLGIDNTTDSNLPIKISGGVVAGSPLTVGLKITQIAAGTSHTLALDENGNVYGWGSNSNGQIGNGNNTPSNLPIKVSGGVIAGSPLTVGLKITQITVGANYALVLDESSNLYAWGQNSNGQLGNGNAGTNSSLPIKISDGAIAGSPLTAGLQITQMAAGQFHALAMDTNDQLYGWGYNSYGQIGNGNNTQSNLPIKISDGAIAGSPLTAGLQITQIATGSGSGHTLALDENGHLYAWGQNNNGQLGNGNTGTNSNLPVLSAVMPITVGVTFDGLLCTNLTVVSDTEITCKAPAHPIGPVDVAVTINGETVTMTNAYEYGPAFTVTGIDPDSGPTAGGQTVTITGTNLEQYLSGWKILSPGYDITLAIDLDGDLWTWGGGQLTPINLSADSTSPLYGHSFVDASSSYVHSMAIDTTGDLWMWGLNDGGQLGTNDFDDSSTPINLSEYIYASGTNPVYGLSFAKVETGSESSYAIDSSGDLWVWGRNNVGQLGDGTNVTSPIPINLSAESTTTVYGTKFETVSSGIMCVFAIDSSGLLWAWGSNSMGQLGDSSGVNSPVPIMLSGDPTNPIYGRQFSSVTAGTNHVLAIDEFGELWTWGNNTNGQLGNNNTTSLPTSLSADSTNPLHSLRFQATAGSYYHSIAIDEFGRLWTWGRNDNNGQLGDGTNINSPIPINISGLSSSPVYGQLFKDVAANRNYAASTTFAIDETGQTWGWGGNSNGELGNGTTSDGDLPQPSAVAMITPVVTVGGSPCTNVTVVSGTEFTCVTAAHAKGYVDVTVTIGGETAILAGAYRYYDPHTVTAVTPDTGPTAGGQTVTITGTNFEQNVGLVQIVGGGDHTLALNENGNLYTWGNNNYGQLGNGTNGTGTNSDVPIKISDGAIAGSPFIAGLKIVQISAGRVNSFALDENGNLYAWGNNAAGQLGRGNNTNSNLPIKISDGEIAGSPLVAGLKITRVVGGVMSNSGSPASSYTLALDENGDLYAWGQNNYGQLGNGNTGTNSNIPIKISDGAIAGSPFIAGLKISQIGASGDYGHSVAVDTNGVLYTWGFNDYGQLGNGITGTNSNLPIKISDGAIASSPLIAGLKINRIAVGFGYTLALDTNNILYAWGNNQYGQVGNGITGTNRNVPTKVSDGAIAGSPFVAGLKIIQISAGYGQPLVLDENGDLYAWGFNQYGQIGNGNNSHANLPIKISDGAISGSPLTAGLKIKQVAAGYFYSFALDANDTLYAWGTNQYGQLGNSNTSLINSTPLLGPQVSEIATVSVTFDGLPCTNVVVVSNTEITCTTPAHVKSYVDVAVTINGEAAILAGAYRYYDPHTVTSITPDHGPVGGGTTVTITGTNFEQTVEWKQISAGGYHTCAIASDDQLYCWGNNNYGQLGDGTNNNSSTPIAVAGPLSGIAIKQISVGGNYTCAIRADNDQLYCWGYNGYGQLGDGTSGSGADKSVPTAVTSPLDGVAVSQVTTSYSYTCAIRASDGQAFCWGYNNDGQLGDGTTASSPIPVAVAGVLSGVAVKQIAAGGSHTCAIRASDEQAFCWGGNGHGQLGDGTTSDQPTPTAVAGPLGGMAIKQIAAGNQYACAIRASDDQAFCWGMNDLGQLGDGTGGSYGDENDIPTAVVGPLSGVAVEQIAPGEYHTCAIRASDGQAFCWGWNYVGQLGDGTLADSSSPVAVTSPLSGVSIKQISAGYYDYTCAIQAVNGQIYCWGDNYRGQLGDGTSGSGSNKSVPTAVDVASLPPATPTVTLDIGGNPAPCINVVVVSSTTITCTTTAHHSGIVDVSVDINGEIATLAAAFEDEFDFTAVTPNEGLTGGGTTLTITGEGFSGTIQPTVYVDGAICTNLTVLSDTALTCDTPKHKVGLVDIEVMVNLEGLTLTDSFNYYSLTLSSITPNYGPTAGGTNMTITGTGFVQNVEWKQVAAGSQHTLAIDSEGNLYAWGWNYYGQLGNGTNGTGTNSDVPIKISDGAIAGSPLTAGLKITQVAGGVYYSLAIDENGDLYAWGYNNSGQLGRGNTTNSNTPIKISGGAIASSQLTAGLKIAQVVAGGSHTFALDENGILYAWGNNYSGQLGRGTTSNSNLPTRISNGAISSSPLIAGLKVTQVAAREAQTFALDENGILYAWGVNTDGQLGNGTYTANNIANSRPIKISDGAIAGSPLTAGLKITQVAAGRIHTVALDENGDIYTWGSNNDGRLGHGDTISLGFCEWGICSMLPIKISGGAIAGSPLISGMKITQIVAGSEHTIAISADGDLYVWGYNYEGQLGRGNNTWSGLPIKISGGVISGSQLTAGLTITQITASSHNLALDDNGNIYAWGSNSTGQFGNGTTTNSNLPLLSAVVQITPTITLDPAGTPAPCTNVIVVNDTTITCTTTAHDPGL